MNIIRRLKDKLKQFTLIKQVVYQFNLKFRGQSGDNSYKYFKYSWDITLNERLTKLKNANPNRQQVVYIYPHPDPLTFRYRGYNMTQVLNKLPDYQGHFFFENELTELMNLSSKIDTLIFIRVGWLPEAEELVTKLKAKGKKIGYDFDDWVFDISSVPLLVKQIAAPRDAYGYYFYYVGTLYNLAKHADYFICTNSYLAEQIEKFFKQKCFVIPNFQNDEQIAYIKAIDKEVARRNLASSGPADFTIGYFSGTKTHDRDFQLIEDQLIRILAEFPQTKLMILGHLTLSSKFDPYSARIIRHGLKNYLELEEYMAACDLNLAPLIINQFTNCKSEIKYTDTAMVYTPTVASPTYCFSQAIDNKVNGLLAKDNEWYSQIKLAITDIKLYRQLQKAAYEHTLANYYGERINNIVEATMEQALTK